MSIIDAEKLPDMQKSETGFPKFPIEKVGVRGIKVPLTVLTKGGEDFNTIATISSYCNLEANTKGINMSRIARTISKVLNEGKGRSFENLNDFLRELEISHGAKNVWIKASFDYIMKLSSPMTNEISYEPVQIFMESRLVGGDIKRYITVKSVEMSLCPCSKEMSLLKNNVSEDELEILEGIKGTSERLYDKVMKSGLGAHNQKSYIDVTVELAGDEIMWIEDLFEIIRTSASAPTYAVLKRPDEKWITEVSYTGGYVDTNFDFIDVPGTGPKFVEDISRQVAEKLNEKLDKSIGDYVVVVNNQESIHSDDIVATSVLTAGRNLK